LQQLTHFVFPLPRQASHWVSHRVFSSSREIFIVPIFMKSFEMISYKKIYKILEKQVFGTSLESEENEGLIYAFHSDKL